jgi:hypothetical protein
MNYELSFKTAGCTEYAQLLHECQRVLERWRRRRDQVAEAHLTGKRIGDELQRLQANYAKAYSRLDRRHKECERCRFVSKIGGRQLPTASSHLLDKSNTHSFTCARK